MLFIRSAPLPGLFCLALFAAIIAGLHHADIYNQHFSGRGGVIAVYNLARLLLIPYLFWLVYWAGWAALRRAVAPLPVASRVILCFFTGAGIWHIALLGVGLAGGYTYAFAVAVSAAVLLCSLPHLSDCLRQIKAGAGDFARSAPPAQRFAAALLALTCLAFLIVKTLYPGGGYDYFTHYFYYYTTVIDTGSVLPNDVWYQFFYSKGAGLYFLAMLLSDPLAPSLAATCFIAVSTLIVFVLVRRQMPGSVWPWLAAALFVGLQLYIRGKGLGPWGQLQKLHEVIASVVLGVLWCVTTLPEQPKAQQRTWAVALALCLVTGVVLTPPSFAIYLALLAVVTAWYWRQGWRDEAKLLIACTVIAGTAMAGMLALNYWLTGIPDNHSVAQLWPFLDFQKMKNWGVLFEIVAIFNYAQPGLGDVHAPLSEIARLFYRFLRLDMLWPLYAGAALYAAWRWRCKEPVKLPHNDAWVYGCLIVATALLAITIGRAGLVSFYRLSSFAFAPMLCFAMWCIARSGASRAIYAALFIAALCASLTHARQWDDLSASAESAWKFATGAYSIDDAYMHQRGLPADAPQQTAIHPAARAAWEIAGRNTRIWSLHNYTYCMLPGCRIESYMSFRFSPSADQIFSGSPEEAKRILQSEGLNYFLIAVNTAIRDPLPLAPLFSPERIAGHLAVRWTDGTAALLTWPGPDTTPIPATWLAQYAKQVEESALVQAFAIEEIADYLEATRHYSGRTPPPMP